MNTKDEIIKQKWKTIISKTNSSFLLNITSTKSVPKHPLVIFYNEDDEMIYYLQGQSYQKDKHDIHIENKDYYHIKYLSTKDNEFIKHDTIIDTTIIHMCKLDDFIKKFKLNEKLDYYTIPYDSRWNILEQLYKNDLFKDNVALKEMIVNDNNLKQEFIYLPENYLDKQLKIGKRHALLKLSYDEKIKILNIKIQDNLNPKSIVSGIIEESIISFLDEVNSDEYDKKWEELYLQEIKENHNKNIISR